MTRPVLLTLAALATLAAGQDTCTPPFISVGGRCVYIDPWETGTMAQMRAFCQSHKGDILWFDDDLDCDFYRALLEHLHEASLNEKDYWMGITDESHSGDWRYIKTNTAARTGPPFWDNGYPSTAEDRNCAILTKSRAYYWRDVSCTATYSTICRYA